jgi:hypothetical protein
MDNKVKGTGNQVNLSPYHKTAGDSTRKVLQTIVESGVRLRPNEEPSQESGPPTYMGNILFSILEIRQKNSRNLGFNVSKPQETQPLGWLKLVELG